MTQTAARVLDSPWLGEIEWEPGSELLFPAGLPGFEDERRILPVEIPERRPLVFLQSVDNRDVCFLALPILVIDPEYELRLTEDERAELLLPAHSEPVIGEDVLCLAMLAPSNGTLKANLTAPLVINLHNSRGMQCVGWEPGGARYQLDPGGQWAIAC